MNERTSERMRTDSPYRYLRYNFSPTRHLLGLSLPQVLWERWKCEDEAKGLHRGPRYVGR